MTTPQAGLLFTLSWMLALVGVAVAFTIAPMKGPDFAKTTGNQVMLGVVFGIVLPIALGVIGIVNTWGFWQ